MRSSMEVLNVASWNCERNLGWRKHSITNVKPFSLCKSRDPIPSCLFMVLLQEDAFRFTKSLLKPQ